MKTILKLVARFFAFMLILSVSVIYLGCEGSAGAPGKDGTDGTNGADGVDGADGADGDIILVADQDAYDAADGIRGGLLWDKWYSTESGISADAIVTDNGDFFRCKACHGWDLIGTSGAYIDRAGTTTRPNVAANNIRAFAGTHNIKEVFTAIKHEGGRLKSASGVNTLSDQMPDYSTLMADADIWDLVKYLEEEAVHTDLLYDLTTTGLYPTGSRTFSNIGKDGVASAGDTYFADNCASCHGADGRTLDLEGKSVGQFIRGKPYETWHKVKFGQPGSSMTGFSNVTLDNLKDLLVAGNNITNFPDL